MVLGPTGQGRRRGCLKLGVGLKGYVRLFTRIGEREMGYIVGVGGVNDR